MLEYLTRETNDYAKYCKTSDKPQCKGKWWACSLKEMAQFIGLRILMGIIRYPDQRMYWSKDALFANYTFPKTMTCKRFNMISKYFHAFNPLARDKNSKDRLMMVRPLMEFIHRRCFEVYQPDKNLSVDEGLLPYKGNLNIKCYNPKKPVKYGIKLYMLCEAISGYVLNLFVYVGDPRKIPDTVNDLVKNYHNFGYLIFMDNLYNFASLSWDLFRKGFHTTGTLRLRHIGAPTVLRNQKASGTYIKPKEAKDDDQKGNEKDDKKDNQNDKEKENKKDNQKDKEKDKKNNKIQEKKDKNEDEMNKDKEDKKKKIEKVKIERNFLDYRRNDETYIINWKDTRLVTMITNLFGATTEKVAVKKKINNKWETVELDKPHAILEYNQYMQGVDLFDQLMGYYTMCRKTRKWTTKLLFYLLQLGIQNAYILYSKFTTDEKSNKLTHRQFLTEVARALINFNPDDWPSNQEFTIPHAPSVDPDVQFRSPRKSAHPTTAATAATDEEQLDDDTHVSSPATPVPVASTSGTHPTPVASVDPINDEDTSDEEVTMEPPGKRKRLFEIDPRKHKFGRYEDIHTPVKISNTELKRKCCFVCQKNGIKRRPTQIMCDICELPLCATNLRPECWKKLHSKTY